MPHRAGLVMRHIPMSPRVALLSVRLPCISLLYGKGQGDSFHSPVVALLEAFALWVGPWGCEGCAAGRLVAGCPHPLRHPRFGVDFLEPVLSCTQCTLSNSMERCRRMEVDGTGC